METIPNTRESLILRLKEGADASAWAEFVAIYRPVVLRLARNRGMQPFDAEDLAQNVMIGIAKAIERWEPGVDRPPFRVWLFKIARNAVLKALTRPPLARGSGSSSILEQLHQQPAPLGDLSSEFQTESRRETLRWAAAQIRTEFTPTTWAMFWETTIEGRSIAESAASHGRSAGAVYAARFRILRRLKQKVDEKSGLWEAPE